MSSQILYFSYVSSEGPTQLNNLKIKMHSPKGYIRVTLTGLAQQLDQQLEQVQQQLKQTDSDTRRCDDMHVKDLFEAFEAIGCSIEGSQQDKEALLEQYRLQRQVKGMTKILHDDCGGSVCIMAYYRDQKHYYLIESYREWPGYDP